MKVTARRYMNDPFTDQFHLAYQPMVLVLQAKASDRELGSPPNQFTSTLNAATAVPRCAIRFAQHRSVTRLREHTPLPVPPLIIDSTVSISRRSFPAPARAELEVGRVGICS